MDILQDSKDTNRKGFISHVFSSTDDSKAEILNTIQYACMGILPIIILNKSIQRFIPEADTQNSSLEILAEILIQLIIMFCGVIIIHRTITYFPTYSGFKYENLTLTNVILAFLIIVLSIQTKMGIKVNILFDRAMELWNGPSSDSRDAVKKKLRSSQPVSSHSRSQADYLDNAQMQSTVYPPAPVATTKSNTLMETYDNMMGGGGSSKQVTAQTQQFGGFSGPMAANSVLGGSFGSSF